MVWLYDACAQILYFCTYLSIPPLPEGGGEYTVLPLFVCPSFRPSVLPSVLQSVLPFKIFVVAFFSVTVDGRSIIFGHKRHNSYFQATNHQWAYLLELDTPQDMLIDWSLTLNGISFSVMWGSIFSIYQSPVSLLFKIGYTPRDFVWFCLFI
jgi:hypothetical protein